MALFCCGGLVGVGAFLVLVMGLGASLPWCFLACLLLSGGVALVCVCFSFLWLAWPQLLVCFLFSGCYFVGGVCVWLCF